MLIRLKNIKDNKENLRYIAKRPNQLINRYKHGISNIKIKESFSEVKRIYLGRRGKDDISILLFIILYVYAYFQSFNRLKFLEFLLYPLAERGETWYIIARLTGNKKEVGLINYDVFPLFNLIPQWIYLSIRYISLGILLLIFVIEIVNIIKIKRKNLYIFDISLAIGSILFMGLGFFHYAILGQRAVQTMFIGLSKYAISKKYKILNMVIVFVILISTLFFSFSILINHTLNGGKFVEDESTIYSGYFIEEYSANVSILTSSRSFSPAIIIDGSNDTYIERYDITTFLNSSNSRNELYIKTNKVINEQSYYRIDIEKQIIIHGNVYDQGEVDIYSISKKPDYL
jgi:hypothetical protein